MNHVQFGFQNKPDILSEASDLSVFGSASMDFVYSSHTLEHVVDYKAVLREWWRVIKPSGVLVLYLPHKNFYPNVGKEGSNPDHKHDFLPDDVIDAMPDGWDLLENQERNEGIEYSFLQVFKKIGGKKNVHSWKKPKPEKTALVVRYGAFGDLMQASSVFKGLKDEGYHVTLHCSNPGADVVRTDPNLDTIILFDRDQVPNGNLPDFWGWQKKKYSKFVNLSESVEGTLLALPGRAQHGWNPLTRHKMLNRNYLEFQHDIAGLPHKPQVKFYPTDEEKAWAKKERARLGGSPFIVYSLSGSSVHKTWAGMDNLIAGILLYFKESKIVLTGGPECTILEQGWEKEPRVVCTSGKLSMRQTLALLDHADLVIGPETGVLNAASHMPMAKVIFLSHSSHENLTRDWLNTTAMTSKNTVCPGRSEGVPACHMMHYGWDHCNRNAESGTAQCQVDITVEDVWNAVCGSLHKFEQEKAA
jgi:ADP-heptose:LPS heptosyltransferase